MLVQGTNRNLSREGVDKTKACPSIFMRWFPEGLLKWLDKFQLILPDINVLIYLDSNSVEAKVAESGRLTGQ